MAPHSSTFAWKIPWMEEPDRLQFTGSLGAGHDWKTSLSLFTFTFHFHALEKEMATHSSVLAWRIPGMAEPAGLPPMGSYRVRHYWRNLAAATSVFHFSRGSSQPRKWIKVSCIAGRFFTNWAIREVHTMDINLWKRNGFAFILVHEWE